MFDSLSDRLDGIFKRLRGFGKLNESNIRDAMREVRMAMLEADVHFRVVKDFVKRVEDKALGADITKSLTPGQEVVKIVYAELGELMGGENERIKLASQPPTIVMMAGLQGSGKTTSAGKLARLLKAEKPLLIACDVYRPAAIDQLQTLGRQLDIAVYSEGTGADPVGIAERGVAHARLNGFRVAIIDTAGRLAIDEEMMAEARRIKEKVQPHEILFVADAMTGQDAVNVAQRFNEELAIDGVVLTKLDGDARGGAALSIRQVTGKPIKFVGMGEKLDALEAFHPGRMADRILGMGDVRTLIEKAQANIDQDQALAMQKKLMEENFTLEDFRTQLQMVKQMGPIEQLLGMIPGMKDLKKQLGGMTKPEDDMKRIEAIIGSMTMHERLHPQVLNGNRRKRIARGSGTQVADVNSLMKEFAEAQKLMKQFGKIAKFGGLGGLGGKLGRKFSQPRPNDLRRGRN
jgi:signal recognition particle subunit SRP54